MVDRSGSFSLPAFSRASVRNFAAVAQSFLTVALYAAELSVTTTRDGRLMNSQNSTATATAARAQIMLQSIPGARRQGS